MMIGVYWNQDSFMNVLTLHDNRVAFTMFYFKVWKLALILNIAIHFKLSIMFFDVFLVMELFFTIFYFLQNFGPLS